MDYRYILEVLVPADVPVRRAWLGVGRHAIGSDGDCALALPVSGVSRRHAEIEVLADGGALIRDLASTNGTRVHGRRIGCIAVVESADCQFGPVHALLLPAASASAQLAVLGSSAPLPAPQAAPAPTTHTLALGVRLAAALTQVLEQPQAERAEALVAALSEIFGAGTLHLLRDNIVLAGVGADGPCVDWMRRGSLALRGQPEPPPAASPFLALALALLAPEPPRGAGSGAADGDSAGDSRSPALRECYRQAARVASSTLPLLLLGESGTGKEVLARWIHAASPRAAAPFIAINCAALPADLMEAELFGVERGAATGVSARPGVIEQAHRGTLFLDELGEMAAATQAKLLRALEATQLYRVGGREPVAIDVRFIAATHRALDERIASGEFRLDLFHRLAAVELRLPPLRERREDLPQLAAGLFRAALAERGHASPGMTAAAVAALAAHQWPGNIRELRNEIRRAVWLLDAGEPLDVSHLSPRLRAPSAGATGDLSLAGAVAAAERVALLRVLELCGEDLERALALLDISRTSFYRKLKDHGLER